jgi:hypothetical protein
MPRVSGRLLGSRSRHGDQSISISHDQIAGHHQRASADHRAVD